MTDPAIEFLSFEDQRHFVWVLCLKNEGVIDKEYPVEGMLDKVMARKLGLSGEAFDNAKMRLTEVDLIDESWQPKNWVRLQFKSDSSAERVRKHREIQKDRRRKRDCNVTETPPEADTEQNRTDTEGASATPAAVVDWYHEMLPALPRVAKFNKTRQGLVRQRIREDLPGEKQWRNFFDYVGQSKFLTGQAEPQPGKPPFLADLEWLCRPTNFTKIAEGKYHRV